MDRGALLSEMSCYHTTFGAIIIYLLHNKGTCYCTQSCAKKKHQPETGLALYPIRLHFDSQHYKSSYPLSPSPITTHFKGRQKKVTVKLCHARSTAGTHPSILLLRHSSSVIRLRLRPLLLTFMIV